MKIFFGFILYIIFTIVLPHQIFAAIFINEFSYQSGSDWVELYNSGCEQVSLEGWKIRDSTESQYKTLSGTIGGYDYFTTDINFLNNSLPDKIRLFDNNNSQVPLVELEIPIQGLSPSSDSQSVGLEIDGKDTTWKIFESPTKNAPNSPQSHDSCPTPTVALTPTPPATGGTQTSASGLLSLHDLIITEVMPDPEDGDEWVEIFNATKESIYLGDIQIDDVDGGSKPAYLSKISLDPSQYYVFYTKSVFNNSGDTVRIIQLEKIIDSYQYTSSTKGVSFAVDENNHWEKTSDPTPGEENSIQKITTPTPTSASTPTPRPTSKPKPTPTPKKSKVSAKNVLSASTRPQSTPESISKVDTDNSDNYFPFYIAASLITSAFLIHSLYQSNRKKIKRKIRKSRLFKRLKKNFSKIV